MNLFDKIDNIQSGDTLIVAGNIPNTLPDDVYERIIERLDGKDVRIVVDATKKLLVNSLKYKPFLIKPNRQELSEIFDTTVKTESDVVKYAQELQKMGAKMFSFLWAATVHYLLTNSERFIKRALLKVTRY